MSAKFFFFFFREKKKKEIKEKKFGVHVLEGA